MKYSINSTIIFIFFISSILTAQVVNGGFEVWVGHSPVGWLTNNTDEGGGIYPITRTTNSNSGNYAVKGEVLSLGPIPEAKIAPLMQSGSNGEGFPFSSRPEKLTGRYMFEPVGGDRFTANVFIRKGEELLGAGTFTTTEPTGTDEYQEMVFNIGYDDTTGKEPDRLDIVFAISSTTGTYTHEGSTFFVDDIPGLKILYPVKDRIVIAGEVDSVLWTAGGIERINLDYSTDRGSSFHHIVDNYPSDSGRYYWDVPDDLLTREAMVKIENSEDSDTDDTTEVFKIKPWQLTRVTSNDKFELFEVDQDGWSFGNFPNAIWPPSEYNDIDYTRFDPISGRAYSSDVNFSFAGDSVHPSWPVFVDAFTTHQCYNGNPPNSFNSNATSKWWSVFGPWGGSCSGFAVSSLLGFYHQSGLISANPGMGSFQNLYSLPSDSLTRDVINKYYTYQFGEPFESYDTFSKQSVDARQLLRELKTMFRKEDGDASILVYFNNRGSGGHGVTPYKMERKGKTSTFDLRLYDSNSPGSENKIILIDSTSNNWTDNTGLGWGTGTNNIYLSLESGRYLTTPTIGAVTQQPKLAAAQAAIDDMLKIYNEAQAEIMITGESGKSIGYADSNITNNIDGAVPKVPITGYNHPPIGYVVPEGNYTVEMNNFESNSSYVYFSTGSGGYIYSRNNALNDETDVINFNSGITVENPDSQERKVNLRSIVVNETNQKIFRAENFLLAQNDIVHIEQEEGNKLMIENRGTAGSYDLRIVNNTESGETIFNHSSIEVNANTLHKIIPDLNNLAEEPVQILVDNGMDGTFNDTLTISNDVTGIKSNGSSGVPSQFKLYGNYPNPFNPATTIVYELPEKNLVTLKVYDILGREVVTLVNERQPAGKHEIDFDASNLPSGIYVYNIKAGEFSSTRKMILIK